MEQPGLPVVHVVAQALAAVRVLHGGDHAGRLVEREEQVGLGGHGEAVHLDLVVLRVDPLALLGDQLAVDLDPALRDQLLTGPPAADTGPRQHLLQALAGLAAVALGGRGRPLVAAQHGVLDPGLQLARALRGGALAALGARALRGAATAGRGGVRAAAVLRAVVAPLLGAHRTVGVAAVVPPVVPPLAALPSAAARTAAATAAAAAAEAATATAAAPGRTAAARAAVGGAAPATAAAPAARAAVPAVTATTHQMSVRRRSREVQVVPGRPHCASRALAAATASAIAVPSRDSASTSSTSGRKGASSGSSSRPRSPIRSRK